MTQAAGEGTRALGPSERIRVSFGVLASEA
jgi:hypothetical protein